MTSELRPALAVWQEAYGVWGDPSLPDTSEADQAAAAVIKAYGDEREAKFKALAETLAGALEPLKNSAEAVADSLNTAVMDDAIDKAGKALREYKEACHD